MTPLAIITAVFNTLWLGAALTAAVWLALKYVRTNAATRSVIWWLVLIVLVALPGARPITTLWHPSRAATTTPSQDDVASAPDHWLLAAANETPAIVTLHESSAPRWPFVIVALWAVVSMYRLTRIGQSYLCLRQMKRNSTLSDVPLPEVGRDFRLLLSRDVASPMAAGFLRPAVILPHDLIDRLTRAELDQILLHESAHLARRDDWANLIARLLGAAFALHPVVWWVLRQIECEREIACDDWVVIRTGAPRAYAETLAHMAELRWQNRGMDRSEEALASGVFGRGSRIGERIEGLLSAGRQFSARVSFVRVVAGCFVLCGLATIGSFAPRWIAFAQAPGSSGKLPEFEVASIKPMVTGVMHRTGPRVHPGGRIVIDAASLKYLVYIAFRYAHWQVSGGDTWMENEQYDIEAKPPAGLQPAISNLRHSNFGIEDKRLREMLQALLVDRFHLRFHRETSTGKVYLMERKGDNPGLRPTEIASLARNSPEEGFSGDIGFAGGRWVLFNVAMPQLAKFAEDHVLHAPVLDKTGLSGSFDYKQPTRLPDSQVDYGNPPFLQLLPELGLKLETTTGPVETFVIDHAERPTPN
jgi:uncharacterized protein (TIGR03435 family)